MLVRAGLAGLCVIASVNFAIAQTREETVNFLFAHTRVNGVKFDGHSANAITELEVTGFTFKEQNCVVTSQAYETSTSSLERVFTNLPISTTICFDKLVMNSAKVFHNDEETWIKVSGDPGAVHRLEPDPIEVVGQKDRWWSRTFDDDSLMLEFPNEKGTRAVNAFKYFVSTFCPGKRSAF